MRYQHLTLIGAAILGFGITAIAAAQENTTDAPSAQQQLQAIPDPRSMGPRSIDQDLAHLTKDLELTPEQQKQVRPLLQEHHDKIQALLDKNPTATRQQLAPQIHAISDETHHEIHALLTPHQQELEKAMVQHMNHGEEQCCSWRRFFELALRSASIYNRVQDGYHLAALRAASSGANRLPSK